MQVTYTLNLVCPYNNIKDFENLTQDIRDQSTEVSVYHFVSIKQYQLPSSPSSQTLWSWQVP